MNTTLAYILYAYVALDLIVDIIACIVLIRHKWNLRAFAYALRRLIRREVY